MRPTSLLDQERGQSIMEAAIMLPLVLILAFNAVNVGYYFFVALNVTTAPNRGGEYSIMGGSTTLDAVPPTADQVSTLVYNDISGALAGTGTTPMQVCSSDVGLINPGLSTQHVDCKAYNSFSKIAADSDPESPYLVLNRVDIQYKPSPLVPGRLFNFVPAPTLHRFVEMRLMN